MQVELKRIQQEVGITFIYVTHDQEEAMTMSDRIAVMNKGRYEQLGEPETLYERPQTRFVAGFLGVSNLLPGKVAERGDPYTSVEVGGAVTVQVPRASIDGAANVDVGVRPEKIRMHGLDEFVLPTHNKLLGTVRDAAYLGVSTQYIVETRAGMPITVYEQNLERATRSELWAPGVEVVLTWSPDHTFVVPTETETPAA
jgi:spermidine/putrescine transport system ATP-binding protein